MGMIAKVALQNHLEKVTCSVAANQQFSQATSVLARWTCELSGHNVRTRGYEWAQQLNFSSLRMICVHFW